MSRHAAVRTRVLTCAAFFFALLIGTASATHPGGTNTISTADIQNQAVTTPKLAPNAVTTGRIAPNAVTNARIALGTIRTGRLSDAVVTARKLAPDSVNSSKVQDGSLTGDDIDQQTLDFSLLQARISDECPIGESIRTIAQNGTVTCQAQAGGGAPSGPAGGDLSGTYPNPTLQSALRLPTACANGQVAKSTGSGAWTCANDANSGGTITGITTSGGLTGGGSSGSIALGVNSTQIQSRVGSGCPANQAIRQVNQDGSVACEGSIAGAPTGSAGGHLSGSYPNPQIAASAPLWRTNGNAGTNPASNFIGTTDDQPLNFGVNDQRALRLEPHATSPNLIAGHANNSVTAGAYAATVSGGGNSSNPNRVTDAYGTVGGGFANRAGDGVGTTSDRLHATVAGGVGNTASGLSSAIGGGDTNLADGTWSTVAGGGVNIASGFGSAVAGGHQNTASGSYSLVAGRQAKNTNSAHSGVFLFADSNQLDFNSAAANEFAVRASGGVRLRTASNLGTGCNLAAGSGTWSCTSDRDSKQGFEPVAGETVLAKLAELPISTWSFKADESGARHMGPTAQDFHAAFGLGTDEKTISHVDTGGVALAAIKALTERNAELEARVAELERSNANP